MVLRIISMGGVFHYLSHPWNVFDCIMVLAGYTTFIPMDSNSAGLEGVKALRALRALRPLRTITRWDLGLGSEGIALVEGYDVHQVFGVDLFLSGVAHDCQLKPNPQ